jgi:hypothetical protein
MMEFERSIDTWQLEAEEVGAGAGAELAGDLPGHGLLTVPGNALKLGRREAQRHGRPKTCTRAGNRSPGESSLGDCHGRRNGFARLRFSRRTRPCAWSRAGRGRRLPRRRGKEQSGEGSAAADLTRLARGRPARKERSASREERGARVR